MNSHGMNIKVYNLTLPVYEDVSVRELGKGGRGHFLLCALAHVLSLSLSWQLWQGEQRLENTENYSLIFSQSELSKLPLR